MLKVDREVNEKRTKRSTLSKNRCCRSHSIALLGRVVPLLDCGNEVDFVSLHVRNLGLRIYLI